MSQERVRSHLVLITGEYPAMNGDYSFIRHEIDEVASRFDRVLIYSFKPVTGPVADMPGNVHYVTALSQLSNLESLTALFNPPRLVAGVRSVMREHRSGRMRGHAGLVLGNILTGERFAAAIVRGARRAGVTSASRVTAYSFWGSHGALALPFLPNRWHRVVRLHRFDLYEGVGGRLPLRASLFGSADAVLPISDDGMRYLREHFGDLIPDGALSVVRLGTADHGCSPAPKPLAERGEGEPIRVVSCSSVIEVKRVESILPAMETIATERPVHWTHFGSGPHLTKLAEMVRSAQLRNPNLRVDLRGQIDNSEVLAYYGKTPIDVFVNVSDSEGVPVSIMEALSFGIPAVATNVGGTGEVVSKELGSGVLLPPRPETEQLVQALISVVVDRVNLKPRMVWEHLSDARWSASQIANVLSNPDRTS